MRIAVLAHGLRLAGGMVVGKNIVKALGRVATEHTYLFVVPANSGYEELCEVFPDHEIITYNPRRWNLLARCAYDIFPLPRAVRAFSPDMVLGLASVGLLRPPAPQAIYFMTPHLCYSSEEQPPESLLTRTTFQMQAAYLKLQLRHTDLLFAQTEAIGLRLQQRFPFRGDVVVSPIAVSGLTQKKSTASLDIPEELAPYKSKFKLLYLTRYYRHKNIERIIEMFTDFGDELSDCVAILTIDGRQDRSAAAIIDAIAVPALKERIINIGPVPHEQLAALYAHSDALLMPTLFESFSSAYVEAMHYGVPIITSDLDFARASCGDAAIYFDPASAAAMAAAVRSLTADPAFAERLRHRGRTRLSELPASWDDIAADLIASLERVVAASRS